MSSRSGALLRVFLAGLVPMRVQGSVRSAATGWDWCLRDLSKLSGKWQSTCGQWQAISFYADAKTVASVIKDLFAPQDNARGTGGNAGAARLLQQIRGVGGPGG